MSISNFTSSLWQQLRPKYFESTEFQIWWRQFRRQWWRMVEDYKLNSNAFVYGSLGIITAIIVGIVSLFIYQEWRIRQALRTINWQISGGGGNSSGKQPAKLAETSSKSNKKRNKLDDREKLAANLKHKLSVGSNTTHEKSSVRQRKANKVSIDTASAHGAAAKEGMSVAASRMGKQLADPTIMDSLKMFCPYIGEEHDNNKNGEEQNKENVEKKDGGNESRRRSMFEELLQDELEEQSDVDDDKDGASGISLFDDVDKPVDPVELSMHLPGEVKRIRTKLQTREVERDLNEQQMRDEREARRKQLEAIFQLMQDQADKFGEQSMNDLNSQLHLYAL